MKKMILAVVLLSLFSSAVAAQVTWTVIPSVVPTEQPFRMTITNKTTSTLQMNGTPYGVYDSNNKFIWPQIGLPFIIYLPPNASTFWTWDQKLSSTMYLAPGAYTARIRYSIGTKSFNPSTPFLVLPDKLTVGGTPAPGNNVKLTMSSPNAPGLAYQMACSFARTPIIPLGNTRELALTLDPLLPTSLVVGPPTFQVFSGKLDSKGGGVAGVLIPNLAALKGQKFFAAYVTLKNNTPNGIFSYCFSRRIVIK